MEDVLEVYTRPYDPLRPQICMDETSKQLLRETRQSLPMEPGKPQRHDYEYERGGVVNLFMFLEPLQGRRWVDVTERRTKTDWAHQIKELVDERYPEAEQIVLVMDNLNTHTPASLYVRLSIRLKPGASQRSSRSTTPPSMAAGSTSPRSS
jgi:DDE superfamily endonuclease